MSGVVETAADRAWAVLRDFSGLHHFAHDVAACEIEDGGPADRIGTVRRIVLKHGGVAREQLVGLSDDKRQLDYTLITPGPFPLETYSECLRVIPITDRDHALVQMTGRFRAPQGGAKQTQAMIRAMYQFALVGMRDYISRCAPTNMEVRSGFLASHTGAD